MEIKGLEKLEGLYHLDINIYQDETGWHIELLKIPEDIRYSGLGYGKKGKGLRQYAVVDLAEYNNINSADEARELYDNLMNMFFDRILPVKNNGCHYICTEVDTRTYTLQLSDYQRNFLLEGIFSQLDYYTDKSWDKEEYTELFELVDILSVGNYEKRNHERTINERRKEYLNDRKR